MIEPAQHILQMRTLDRNTTILTKLRLQRTLHFHKIQLRIYNGTRKAYTKIKKDKYTKL